MVKTMNAAKAVARINPRIHCFERGIGGFGAITEADILLALSLITSQGARLLGRVLYAGQANFQPDLWLTMTLETHIVAGREGWKESGAETGRVCRLALREFLSPRHCSYCKGQESVPDPTNPRLMISCQKCAGQGSRAWSESRRAREAEMGREYWQNHWNERYCNRILPVLDKYHDILWQGIARRLGD